MAYYEWYLCMAEILYIPQKVLLDGSNTVHPIQGTEYGGNTVHPLQMVWYKVLMKVLTALTL